MSKKLMTISNMKSGFKYEYAQVLTDIFKSYNLFISDEGDFVDSITKEKLRLNHVKCMLRNDYLRSGHGQLTGKMLCAIIDRYLIGVMKAAKFITHQGDSAFVSEMEIREKFIK